MVTTSTCFWQFKYCDLVTVTLLLSLLNSRSPVQWQQFLCLFWPAKNSHLRALKMLGYPSWMFISWSWWKECPLDSSGDTALGGSWASLHDEFFQHPIYLSLWYLPLPDFPEYYLGTLWGCWEPCLAQKTFFIIIRHYFAFSILTWVLLSRVFQRLNNMWW